MRTNKVFETIYEILGVEQFQVFDVYHGKNVYWCTAFIDDFGFHVFNTDGSYRDMSNGEITVLIQRLGIEIKPTNFSYKIGGEIKYISKPVSEMLEHKTK